MKKNIVRMSLITILFMTSGSYAGKIMTDTDLGFEETKQYGFTGWNLENILVKIVSIEDFKTSLPGTSFDEVTGIYSPMTYGMSFESEISTDAEVRGLLHGKNWPVGEPSGIKIINGDMNTKNGKPENCIMTTSYLSADDTGTGESGYLDTNATAGPVPTTCSSPFQTHKRFKINMMPSMVANPVDGYGQPVDMVFNLEDGDIETRRYQVFQKINNYTGMRLDGYKIEVLDENGTSDGNLTLSIGIGEHRDKDGQLDGTNIWDVEDMANFSHGLWGPIDDHFPTIGFFDSTRAGFVVDPNGHGTSTLVGGPTTLGSNYNAIFGSWLPSKWTPIGMFWDDDNDTTTDAQLVAFWGTVPGALNGEAPAWHKGIADNWVEPSDTEFLQWATDPLYFEDEIEDTLNLGLNYIVNVGSNAALGNKFTIRITAHISADQTPPSYVDYNISPPDNNITPPDNNVTPPDNNVTPPDNNVTPPDNNDNPPIVPIPPLITDGTVAISPAPTFEIGTALILSVKDEDQNIDPVLKDTTMVTVTTDTGDKEIVTLTETEVDNAIFTATIPSELTTNYPVEEDGKMNVIQSSVVTVTYTDDTHSDTASTVATIAIDENSTDDAVDSSGDLASSGGGGCTYNQNSKSFDMMFLLVVALGLLFPFRRRFIK